MGESSRREFLQLIGLGAAAAMSPPSAVYGDDAKPTDAEVWESLVPADKHLDPAWIKSLFDRGTPEVYSKKDFKFIGMPIGGLCAGQLYLGGEGKLWLWDIFNGLHNTAGEHYANPIPAISEIDQGFSLRIGDKTFNLDAAGFSNVTFRGEYPIGIVMYKDPACPVTVTLEAFSPFCPLDADFSSLPATVLRITISNSSPAAVDFELHTRLENAVCKESRGRMAATLKSEKRLMDGLIQLYADGPEPLREQPDFGTMCLVLLDQDSDWGFGDSPEEDGIARGRIHAQASLQPNTSRTISFAITWHFPNMVFAVTRWDPKHAVSPKDVIEKGRYYATKFDSASAVAKHLADNHEAFYQQTKLWRDTWYDSTLPYWFLDRTIANISTLATNTVYRFANGRFWGYEGVGSCRGTCTHVYGYEQSVGRLFPELDVLLRERTDFGVAFNPATGQIGYRGEHSEEAVDGQCMLILRTLRDHQMSSDNSFLTSYWPKIKKAVQWLIGQDKNNDGILTSAQANTLDAKWYGAVPWISGLYIAALRAAEEMASIVGDHDFVEQCKTLREAGQKNFVPRMFNGEYFVQVADPKHKGTVGSYDGCEIDQVLGQSWAFQVGLGHVLPEKETHAALASLWKYNFARDVGLFRSAFTPGRWFAMAGETGTLMCSWPHGQSQRVKTGFDYYFNECMNGFEHQLAGHMINEGMVQEGLAIERAVHDRYHAGKRNPWNEIECGDHYARSMASLGVFLAACGYEYDGPAGRLAFAPKLSPENFKSAFITAEGWGTFSQVINGQTMKAWVAIKHGKLKLRTLVLVNPEKLAAKTVSVTVGGKAVDAKLEVVDGQMKIQMDAVIEKVQTLEVVIG